VPRTLRSTTAVSLFLLAGVCAPADLLDIQQTEPIRTTKFTGAHNTVARCIYDRIGGRTTGAEFAVVGDRLVVYDSVKGLTDTGLTHYAITILKTGPNQGSVEWRIIRSEKRSRDDVQNVIPLSESMVQRFWIPAQECAERARLAP